MKGVKSSDKSAYNCNPSQLITINIYMQLSSEYICPYFTPWSPCLTAS